MLSQTKTKMSTLTKKEIRLTGCVASQANPMLKNECRYSITYRRNDS
jgi:hypothetical protein